MLKGLNVLALKVLITKERFFFSYLLLKCMLKEKANFFDQRLRCVKKQRAIEFLSLKYCPAVSVAVYYPFDFSPILATGSFC